MLKCGRTFLALLLAILLPAGCGLVPYGNSVQTGQPPEETASGALTVVTLPPEEAEETETPAPSSAPPEAAPASEAPETPAPAEEPEETPEPEAAPSPFAPDESGEYTDPLEVAAYITAFGHLPPNYITKRAAQDLGWPGGDLWRYAPGKSIGGDRFGNYEGLLPKGRYKECDVNYSGGSRGAERLIYDETGSVWYTDDHYESFTRLYEGGEPVP